ncbi:MAG: universal stress protein, partial [Pseudomonadales bacterium]
MPTMKNILVALGSADEARYVLRKAAALATANHARLHAVRVVHEGVADIGTSAIDASAELKSFILASAETELEEWLTPARRHVPDLDSVTLWNARTWEGLLHAAEQAAADLIIHAVSTHHKFGDVVRTPDDWNLLRHAPVPVMLVKPQPWVDDPIVVCALDPFDDAHQNLNVALLQESQGFASVLRGELVVVVAYPLFEPWVGQLGATGSYEEIRQSIDSDIRDRVDALARQAGVRFKHLIVEEGHATEVIGRVVEDTVAELLV